MKIDYKWRVFMIVAVGIFISTLDGSIVNIANPQIAGQLGITMDRVEWVVTAYLLVITATLILFGRIGDHVGNERVYGLGFLIFSLGSLGCSMAESLAGLIITRVFQGLGASMMMATGIGIISNTFASSERGKALGLTGTIVALGNMVGPGLGGILLSRFAWPAIFLINVPIGLVGFYLGRRTLQPTPPPSGSLPYDIPGMVLLAGAFTTFILALDDYSGAGLGLWLTTLLLTGLLYAQETRVQAPILDLALFQIPAFVQANLVAVVVYSTQTSVFFLMPFYMQSILGLSPAYSGLLMTIPPIIMAVTAPLAGHVSDKIGSSHLISGSLFMLTAAFLCLSRLGQDQVRLFIGLGLLCLGIGLGMFGSPNTSSILGAIPRQKAGYGGGFIASNRNLSYALGITCTVALFSGVLQREQSLLRYTAAYTIASRTVYLTAAALTFLTLILWLYIQRKTPRS